MSDKNTELDKFSICTLCGSKDFTHRFAFPDPLPEGFYDMFPEERGKNHPKDYRLCLSCMIKIGS